MKARGQKRLDARKQPRQRRAQRTVEDVLTAAAQVFQTLGYAAGTTNRIAERAGVSIGTIYQYYPSKEAIAVALVERHIGEGMRWLNHWVALAVAKPRSLRDTLRLLVDGMIALHENRPRLQHILFEETPLPPRVREALLLGEREAARTVAGLLRLHPDARHTRVLDAAVMAVATVECLTHRYSAHPGEGLSREVFAKELVAMLEAYLNGRPCCPPRGNRLSASRAPVM